MAWTRFHRWRRRQALPPLPHCVVCGQRHLGAVTYQAPPGEAPPDDEIWTMRDGTQIAVRDMDENHVRNALRMVLRKAREAQQRQQFLQRSDLADDYASHDDNRYGDHGDSDDHWRR